MITRQATMVTSETALTLNLAKNSGTWKVTSEVKFLGVAPSLQLRGVLQEVRHADSRDQNGQRARLTARVIGQTLDENTENGYRPHKRELQMPSPGGRDTTWRRTRHRHRP